MNCQEMAWLEKWLKCAELQPLITVGNVRCRAAVSLPRLVGRYPQQFSARSQPYRVLR